MADSLETEIRNPEARYTNPAKLYPGVKKPRYDPSQDRAGWVSGCSAALVCRDSGPPRPPRGTATIGWTPPTRGQRSVHTPVAAPPMALCEGLTVVVVTSSLLGLGEGIAST